MLWPTGPRVNLGNGDGSFSAASTCSTVAVLVTAALSALTITSSQNPSVTYMPVTFTVHLAINGQAAPVGTQFDFKSTVQQPDRSGQPGSKLQLLTLTPLFSLTFSLRRKQRANLGGLRQLTVALVLLTCAWTLTGCGNKYPVHTMPGSYTIQVTATSTPISTLILITRTAIFARVVTP